MSKRVKTGDVVEIHTARGLAYALYAIRHEQMGGLLYILPGFFQRIPTDFSELVKQSPRFVVFLPIEVAVQRGIFKVVANIPVPNSMQKLPMFKQRGHIDRQGRVYDWILREGERVRRVGRQLSPDYRRLPEYQIVNDTLLVERVEENWTPELEMQRIENRGSGETPPWSGVLGIIRRFFGKTV